MNNASWKDCQSLNHGESCSRFRLIRTVIFVFLDQTYATSIKKLQQVTIRSMRLVYLSTNLPSKNQPFMWVNISVPWILRGKNLWKIWVFGSELWMDHTWPMVVMPQSIYTQEVLHSEEKTELWEVVKLHLNWSIFVSLHLNFQASKLFSTFTGKTGFASCFFLEHHTRKRIRLMVETSHPQVIGI